MAKIILITGGARSGKSRLSLQIARKYKKKKAFLATAVSFDKEMKIRIQNHQKERGNDFITVEESLHLKRALKEIESNFKICIIDCITVWLGNLFHFYKGNTEKVTNHIHNTMIALNKYEGKLIIVTNETGLGIIPDNKLARDFRDVLGNLNAEIARKAKTVYFCVSGIPMKVKG